MNDNLTTEQYDELYDLVQDMCQAAETAFATRPEKRAQSLKTYRGILEFAEDANFLTENQMKVIITGARILKLPVPLWLTISFDAANRGVNLDRANLDVPPHNSAQPLAELAKGTQALVNLVERLEQRIGVLEAAIASPKTTPSTRGA